MTIDLGMTEEQRTNAARSMSKLLADTYLLYIKTHKFHWNVTGPHFAELHQMFEEQYKNMAEAVDIIAERVRALGCFAPGSYAEFMELASIKEEAGQVGYKEMIEQLMHDHEKIVKEIRQASIEASKVHDEASVDLFNSRTNTHEKMAWMLRSLLTQ